MCLLCADGAGDRALARRAHVLKLLALIEHPDALPVDAVLRLGREIMMLIRPESGLRRCDPVTPPGADAEKTL
jgi:hypothetical protein